MCHEMIVQLPARRLMTIDVTLMYREHTQHTLSFEKISVGVIEVLEITYRHCHRPFAAVAISETL